MAPKQAKLSSRRSPKIKAHHSPKATGSERTRPERCSHPQELVPSAGRTRQGATERNPMSDASRKCPVDGSFEEGLQVKVSVAQALEVALRDHQHRNFLELENTINPSTSQQPHRKPSGQDALLRDILSGQTGNFHTKMLGEKAHLSYKQALDSLIENLFLVIARALGNLPSNYKVGETDGDEAGKDHSQDEDHSPDVVTPRSISVGYGAPQAVTSEPAGADEVAIVGEVDNVGAITAVASVAPLAPWIGKRRRTPRNKVTSRLKWGAVGGLLLSQDSSTRALNKFIR